MALPWTTKLIIGLVIGTAGSYLAFAGDAEGVMEYVYVNQVMERPAHFQGRTFKVHGTVVEGTVKQKVGAAGDYTFEVQRDGSKLAVHFTNMVPDTFQEGGEVILTGRLSPDGTTFESDEMAAKCPSKYEEQAEADRNGAAVGGE